MAVGCRRGAQHGHGGARREHARERRCRDTGSRLHIYSLAHSLAYGGSRSARKQKKLYIYIYMYTMLDIPIV